MTQLTSPLHAATNGGLPVLFGSIVAEGAGTTGVPKMARAANVSGDYGDARVVPYDVNGNPRGNLTQTILASAARTATTASAALTNYYHRGVQLDIQATAKAGATTLTPRMLDGSAGSVIVTGPALGMTVGQTYSMQIYPGVLSADFSITGSGRSVAVPRTFIIQLVHSDGSSITYSVVCHFIV